MAKLNTTSPLVIGVDPGGSHTGIIARSKNNCLFHDVIHRANAEPVEPYAARVANQLVMLIHRMQKRYATVEVQIERVIPPRWHNSGKVAPVNPSTLIDVAIVAGMMAGHSRMVLGASKVWWVRPGGHGKAPNLRPGKPLDTYMRKHYPAAILPERDGTKYQDQGRHARSAWDISKEQHNRYKSEG